MRRLAIGAAVAAMAASGASAHPGHGPVTVLAANFAYDPANVIVGQGDSVVWYFSGAVDRNHSITSDPGQADQFDSDPGVASPPDKPRNSYYARVFRTVGKFQYHCKNHLGMRGTVEVRSVSGTVDDVPPTLSVVGLSRTRVCARRTAGCRTTRAALTFRLSEPADLVARIQRLRRGRWRTAKVLDFAGRRGTNRRTLKFRGLAAGRYRLLLKAYDTAQGKSRTAKVGFRVRRQAAR